MAKHFRLDFCQPAMDDLITAVNTSFILSFSIIVFFMQAGFAFLEAGSVRAKNTTNILIKNILDAAVGSIIYWSFGYAFGYGGDGNSFIGYKNFFLIDVDENQYPHYFSAYVFAATASTICSGAISERAHLSAYLLFTVIMTGFIYPVVTHWVWSDNGWLHNLGYIDFAGSSVVHCVGGAAALVGASIVGPRLRRFDGPVVLPIPGHSVVLVALGFFILWFGFFAFNGVSEGGIAGDLFSSSNVARAVVNTGLSAVGSLITTLCIYKLGFKKIDVVLYGRELKMITLFGGKWSVVAAINGGLSGMVSVCAGAFGYEPWAAFVVGCVGGALYVLWARLLLFVRIDDPMEASPVHLGSGIWGTIAVAFFIHPDRLDTLPDGGILYAWNGDAFIQLGIQCIGAAVIIAWSMFWVSLVFGFLRIIGFIRVTKQQEQGGLDYIDGELAYPIDPMFMGGPSGSLGHSDSSRNLSELDSH